MFNHSTKQDEFSDIFSQIDFNEDRSQGGIIIQVQLQ